MGASWREKFRLARFYGLLALLSVVSISFAWVSFSRVATAAAAVAPTRKPVPSAALLLRWQPLRPNLRAATLHRGALKAAVAAYKAKRWSSSCTAVARMLTRLEARAARLFYAPVRKGADLDGIDRFLARYVHGKAPLLEVAGELFVPAAAVRALAVESCMRAKKPAIADRFLAHAALTRVGSAGQRLRTALALVRWQATGTLSPWLIAGSSGGARTWLLRAAMAPAAMGRRHMAHARRVALATELPDVRAIARWLESQR